MFAPVGYTPLSILWHQFVDRRLDAIYHSAANHYASEGFDGALVRGSPLDIAEQIFLELMWKCWAHAATPDGTVTRLHSRFDDSVTGLFTRQSPNQSLWGAVITELEHNNRAQIERIAGPYFEECPFELEEAHEWQNAYPTGEGNGISIPGARSSNLRFHTMPICFERERFSIVEALPIWARLQKNKDEAELLVRHFPGQALCVPDSALEGWEQILSGATATLPEDQLRSPNKGSHRGGRPSKIPGVTKAYEKLYPEGHKGAAPIKVVRHRVEQEIGESVSESTLRKAIKIAFWEADAGEAD